MKQIPVMTHKDEVLSESYAILKYLEWTHRMNIH